MVRWSQDDDGASEPTPPPKRMRPEPTQVDTNRATAEPLNKPATITPTESPPEQSANGAREPPHPIRDIILLETANANLFREKIVALFQQHNAILKVVADSLVVRNSQDEFNCPVARDCEHDVYSASGSFRVE